jgi:four helix bundle protein
VKRNAEFKQFLIIARASVSESQNQLLIARDLGFMNKDIFNKLSNDSVEIHKMINGLIKTLKLKNL